MFVFFIVHSVCQRNRPDNMSNSLMEEEEENFHVSEVQVEETPINEVEDDSEEVDQPMHNVGCVCSPLTDEPERYKCDYCLLVRKAGKIDPGCLCVASSWITMGTCDDCNLPNYYILAIVRAAVGQAIRQHFVFEHDPDEEKIGYVNYRRVGGPTGRRPYTRCGLCKPGSLNRRFGKTPPQLRRSLEKEVLKNCVTVPSFIVDKGLAVSSAEKYVHSWMDLQVKKGKSRKQKGPYSRKDACAFYVMSYCPENTE